MIKFYIQAETIEDWLTAFQAVASHPSNLSDQLRNINHELREIKKTLEKQTVDQALIDQIFEAVKSGKDKLEAVLPGGEVNPA